jgi:hypothetical protein
MHDKVSTTAALSTSTSSQTLSATSETPGTTSQTPGITFEILNTTSRALDAVIVATNTAASTNNTTMSTDETKTDINSMTTDTNSITISINNTPTSTKSHTPFSTTKSAFSLQLKKPISFIVLAEYSDSDRTVICPVCNVSFLTKDSKAYLCTICQRWIHYACASIKKASLYLTCIEHTRTKVLF